MPRQSLQSRLKRSGLILWLMVPGLLAGLTRTAWNHRFEAVPGLAPVTLAAGDGPRFQILRGEERVQWLRQPLRLQIDAREPNQYPTVEVDPGEIAGASHVWVRMTASGEGLEAGRHEWERARLVANHRDDQGQLRPRSPGLFNGVDTFAASSICKVVEINPKDGRLYLTLQNLALAGTFTIEDLEIRAVRNRPWFPAARLALGFGWFWWILAVIGRWLGTSAGALRRFAGATVFFGAASFLVFPGPWHPLIPLGPLFLLPASPPAAVPSAAPVAQPPPAAPAPVIQPPPPTTPGQQAAPAAAAVPRWQVPAQSPPGTSLMDRIFQLKKHFRPLMHLSAFAALTLLFSTLLDPGKGWIPVATLALAGEAMQVAFGFGLDALDGFDLLVDAAGIACGLWLCRQHRLKGLLKGRLKA